MLYRFHRDVDFQKESNVNKMFIDQIEYVLQNCVEVVLHNIEPKSVTMFYKLSKDGLAYCEREKVEHAVFMDLLSDTFDLLLSYSHLFPITDTFKSYESLQNELKFFSIWVLHHLEKEQYHKLTKEQYKIIRSSNASSKAISSRSKRIGDEDVSFGWKSPVDS